MDLKKIKEQKTSLEEKIAAESDVKKKVRLIKNMDCLLFSEISYYMELSESLKKEFFIKHEVMVIEEGEGQQLWIDDKYIGYFHKMNALELLCYHGLLREDETKIEKERISYFIWYENPDDPLKIEK